MGKITPTAFTKFSDVTNQQLRYPVCMHLWMDVGFQQADSLALFSLSTDIQYV